MKTTSRELLALKTLLPLTNRDFKHFYRIWEQSQVLDVDSRFLGKGGLFLAQRGENTDGHRFIPEMINKGAMVLCDPAYPRQSPGREKKIIRIPHLFDWAGKLGALFYHFPSEKLRVVGVTGTDGKTSTVRLLAEAYHSWGYSTAGIGTLGVYKVGNSSLNIPHQDTPNTTPDSIILQRILYSLLRQGVKMVVMEVSSHGLSLGRVQEIAFDSGIWTNFSPEHLDYHTTLENYVRTKSRLFELLEHSPKKKKHAIIGLDSFLDMAKKENLPWICEIVRRIKPQAYPLSFFHFRGRSEKLKHFLSPNMKFQISTYSHRPSQTLSQEVVIQTGKNLGNKKRIFPISLIGQFNAQNLTAAFLELEGFRLGKSPRPGFHQVKKIWKQVKIKGRLEEFSLLSNHHPRRAELRQSRIYIDYAHTPQALEKVLLALRTVFRKKIIIVVFGCGGDRDKVKRKPMGAVACQHADISLITDDNPRNEDPRSIRQIIVSGWQDYYHQLSAREKTRRTLEVIPGRKEAIQKSLEIVPIGGVILLAGKGHEDYQIIGKKKFPFDERTVLREILMN